MLAPSSTGVQPTTTSYARKLMLKCTLTARYCTGFGSAGDDGCFHSSSETPT